MTAPARIGAISTPPPAPLEMPTQSLGSAPTRTYSWPGLRVLAARLIAFGGAAALAYFGFTEMTEVFGNETSTPLQAILLTLFTVTFGWIAFSATQTVAALFAPRAPKIDGAVTPAGRTALIMPVYNEDPSATTAALRAMGEGLPKRGGFEIFILSDTRDPEVWVRETACYDWLRAAFAGHLPVWYRRREENKGRKAGNLREFVERWGGRYDHFLVLDADSLMAPETIVEMTRRMEAAPRLGILQTAPTLIGGETTFARLQQFASRLYGPIIARGVAAWQGRDGNYWGHNALIRTRAFAENCGLPELKGRMPFGGHVLSHDFVEAALIRRGGWEVRMDPDLEGSWEGSPPSLLDLAARDRRWAQGNLQHVKVIAARGLTLSNRAHFAIGIGAYLMSPIWLAMLATGALLTAQSLIYERDYFPNGLQLFPNWPVFDAQRMFWLFGLSMALLLTPKLAGVARAIAIGPLRRKFGGGWRILRGAGSEIMLSALYAPILMSIQVKQLFEILIGRDSGWATQSREGGAMTWRDAIARHWRQVAVATGLAALFFWLTPDQLIWVSPVLAGLIAAPALSRLSGDAKTGRLLSALAIPEDFEPPATALGAAAAREALRDVARTTPLDLAHDAALRAGHEATLTIAPPRTEAARLAAITARAKIEAADRPEQALGWMDRAETTALLSSPDLLALWARRGPRTRSAAAVGE